MPESDVTKMKVADLKRELKMRGLPLNGNKNELQDRLQTALLEGDISLEDSAIADAIADGIDDDVSFTDEDEHKLLGDDHEDLLLKSPVSTPTASTATLPELLTATTTPAKAETANETPAPKKIVLKRNNSQQHLSTLAAATATPAKENAAPKAEGSSKPASDTEETSATKTQRKRIVAGGSTADTKGASKKLVELTIQERLELRAKKFGITVNAASPAATAATASPVVNKSSSASIKANNGNKETDEQQKEALKRRAERFGCVVPEKTSKTLADEKLQKRKERFGATPATTAAPGATTDTAASATDPKAQGDWAEKARARLERFKTTPTAAPEATK